MTAPQEAGPLPVGGGPTPRQLQAALHAAAGVAEKLDLPLTMRQLGALLDAATPHLVVQEAVGRTGDVQAAPYVRMVRSLLAAGWTQHVIAARLAMPDSDFSRVLLRQFINRRTGAAIEAVFLHLYDLDPLKHGTHPRGVTRSRNEARMQGWEVIPAAEVEAMRFALLTPRSRIRPGKRTS